MSTCDSLMMYGARNSTSTGGPGGGYTSARRTGEISLADFVNAVETPAAEADDAQAPAVLARELWARLDRVMLQHREGIFLAEVVDEQVAVGVPVEARPPRRGITPRAAPRAVQAGVPNSVFAFGRTLGG